MIASCFHIPKLEDNFDNWLFRIEILLDEKGLRKVIESRNEKKAKEEEFIKQDSKARNIIIQGIPDKYLDYVKNASTAHDMITKLKSTFQRKSTLSSLCLKRQLINLKCSKNQSVQDHINKFEKLVQDIANHGIVIDEKEKVCQFLLSIEQAYQPLVTALEMSNSELTLDFVKSKLLDAEMKEKSNQGVMRKTNEYVFESTSQIKCYNCGEPNHFARNCPKRNFHQRGRGSSRSRGRGMRQTRKQTANIGEEHTTNKEVSFVAAQANSAENTQNHVKEEIEFVIDSGASHHMISHNFQKYMTDLQKIPRINIKVADGNTIGTTLKGKLKGISKEGLEISIPDCLILEKLSHNLLAVRKLNEKVLHM